MSDPILRPNDPDPAPASPAAPADSATLCAEVIVHLARLAQAGPSPQALTPAQWMALRYFARAKAPSRTPSAFSEFHATTRGTASQTVKSLVSLGFLERRSNEADGRSVRFEVTGAGLRALQDDPLNGLARVLGDLPPASRDALLSSLRRVTADLAAARAAPVFGTCGDCTHFQCSGDGGFCRCTEMRLLNDEIASLCIDHRPRPA